MAVARAARDYEAPSFFEAARHPVPVLTDEQIVALISPDARFKVIEFEVTSRQYYERHYVHPEAPGGMSGIPIGIGYDVGQMKPADVTKHWTGLISDADLNLLVTACPLRGDAARAALSRFKNITVPWDVALEVYERATIPSYGRQVLNAFPNAVETKGHSFGALFSLVYNRGGKLEGDSRLEMRRIRDLMEIRQFDDVPAQVRAMKRLWIGKPSMGGVVKRREQEAIIFERGLELIHAPPVATAPQRAGLHLLSWRSTERHRSLRANSKWRARQARKKLGSATAGSMRSWRSLPTGRTSSRRSRGSRSLGRLTRRRQTITTSRIAPCRGSRSRSVRANWRC